MRNTEKMQSGATGKFYVDIRLSYQRPVYNMLIRAAKEWSWFDGEKGQYGMADKELRKMNRAELIEIIYALQQNEKSLRAENEELHRQLDDKLVRMENAGSIAEAVLSLNHVFEAAESAAQQYMDSLREANVTADQIIEDARQKAAETIRDAEAFAGNITEQSRQIEAKSNELKEKTEAESNSLKEKTEAECSALRAQTDEYINQQRSNLLNEAETLFQKYKEMAKDIQVKAEGGTAHGA